MKIQVLRPFDGLKRKKRVNGQKCEGSPRQVRCICSNMHSSGMLFSDLPLGGSLWILILTQPEPHQPLGDSQFWSSHISILGNLPRRNQINKKRETVWLKNRHRTHGYTAQRLVALWDGRRNYFTHVKNKTKFCASLLVGNSRIIKSKFFCCPHFISVHRSERVPSSETKYLFFWRREQLVRVMKRRTRRTERRWRGRTTAPEAVGTGAPWRQSSSDGWASPDTQRRCEEALGHFYCWSLWIFQTGSC